MGLARGAFGSQGSPTEFLGPQQPEKLASDRGGDVP